MQLIKVKYIISSQGELSTSAYTYFSETDLEVGDSVIVPVRDTTAKAQVIEVDVDEAEIAAFRDKVKIIPVGAKEQPTIPEGKLGDDWKEIKPLGPFTNTPDGEGTWLDKPDPNAWWTGDEEVRMEPGSFNCPVKCRYAMPEGCAEEDKLEAGGTYEPNKDLPMCPVYEEDSTPGGDDDKYIVYEDVEVGKDVALIRVKPQDDIKVITLANEAARVLDYANKRIIASDAALTPATEDLSVIAKLKKSLAEAKAEYVKPIKGHLDDVNAAFNMILKPLEEADRVTRDKIMAYRAAVQKRAAEAEEINRRKAELARKEAEFSGTGEFMIDTTPVEAPAPVNKVQTEIGSTGVMKVTKWELVDFAAVPDRFKVLDSAAITKLVKAGGSIPGIRVYTEETLRVNTR